MASGLLEAVRQEAARDGEARRQATKSSVPLVDARPDDSPSSMSSPDVPLRPRVFENTPTHENGRLHPTSSCCGDAGPEPYGRSPLPTLSSKNELYELEAAAPPRNTANESLNMFRTASEKRRDDVRRTAFGGPLSPSAARSTRLWGLKATPATVIHRSKATDGINAKRGSTEEGMGADPFLGTGPTVRRHTSANSASTRRAAGSPSPSPVRLQSSQTGGSPGLLGLHDAQDEVLSLLDTLKSRHRDQVRKEVDAALKRCQEDIKARSKDKTIGTAESNILDREAARIGRARDEASRKAPGAYGAYRPTENEALGDSLRQALARLMKDARAAVEAIAKAKSQAASGSSRESQDYIPYGEAEEFRPKGMGIEKRTLSEQIERLKEENEHAHRVNSDLQKRLDELEPREIKAGRRTLTVPSVLGPWGKEWNVAEE